MSGLGPTPYPVATGLDWIDERQMVEVDRLMIDEFGIDLVRMMENAGRNLARLVIDLAAPARVAIAAGSGGNGGGGLVAARHLANAGVDVVVTTTRSADGMAPVPAEQLRILERMGATSSPTVADADVVVDAVIGYSLRGAPPGRAAELIAEINAASTVIALDAPSGLDVTTGATPGTAVAADATMTLALPKLGLAESELVGDLYLADISVPRDVVARIGAAPPDFRASPIVTVARE